MWRNALNFKISMLNIGWEINVCNKYFYWNEIRRSFLDHKKIQGIGQGNFKHFFIFTFFYPYNGRESIIFKSNFRNGDFDEFTQYEVAWVRKFPY